jgi:hypothetical protein
MRSSHVLALAALLTATAAAPALADWDHLGDVTITRGADQSAYARFGGRVEALYLTARDTDVACRNVTVNFGDGERANVFSGRLDRGRGRAIDLPGRQRLIRRIDFDCRPDRGPAATVDISAEIGNYRDEWRRSPDWAGLWSRQFAWANERGPVAFADRNGDGYPDNPRGFRERERDRRDDGDWIRLGTEAFEGRRDVESSFAGFRGRDLDTIGLRPLNDDARCRRVTATFRNGQTRDLGGADFLRQDRVTRIDIPGRNRNVMSVNLACRAENGRQVTIEILGQR